LPASGGRWAPGTALPVRVAENAAVALGGRIYLAGGLDIDGKTVDTFQSYDPTTDTWTSLPPLPEPRDHMGLAVVDDKIYLTGGGIFFQPKVSSGTWAFDPATSRWTALAPMPKGRWQHASAVVEGRIYLVGGVIEGNSNNRETWMFDPATGDWRTDLALMPTEREHLSAVASGGRVIALGGRKVTNFGAVEAYDPATDTWETLPSMPTPRGGMAVGLIGDVVHAAGGENLAAMSTYPDHETLDLATMTWSRGPDMLTKRHGLASAVVDGRWYVIGGGRAAMLSVSDIVEVFTP
jgi:N-acetylneuraminic acid mutarotase